MMKPLNQEREGHSSNLVTNDAMLDHKRREMAKLMDVIREYEIQLETVVQSQITHQNE